MGLCAGYDASPTASRCDPRCLNAVFRYRAPRVHFALGLADEMRLAAALCGPLAAALHGSQIPISEVRVDLRLPNFRSITRARIELSRQPQCAWEVERAGTSTLATRLVYHLEDVSISLALAADGTIPDRQCDQAAFRHLLLPDRSFLLEFLAHSPWPGDRAAVGGLASIRDS